MYHPTAVVSSDAIIGNNVEIGPYCVVESGVTLGDRCSLFAHSVIKSGVTVGKNNKFYEGAVIGGLPQHVSAQPPFGTVQIGDDNVIRENVTIHRSMKEMGATIIGNCNYLMGNAHIAHDCVIGNNNILVNNVMLAGHVFLHNNAMIGGAAAVHQNCRVGSLTMIGGQAHIVQDVPPFVTVDGLSGKVVGLNLVGLRRNGRTTDEIKVLKSAYFSLYRCGLTWKETLEFFQDNYSVGPAAEMTQFLLLSKRGVLRERAAARAQLRVLEAGAAVSEIDEKEVAPVTIRAIG